MGKREEIEREKKEALQAWGKLKCLLGKSENLQVRKESLVQDPRYDSKQELRPNINFGQ